jgi:succinate dehydrogenase / fumarate reductase flavoprotein subunit
MLLLSRVITVGALLRDESRGSHYKPEFPDRNDDKYMKTTMAELDGTAPKITYKDIDTSLVKPVKRDYTGKTPPPADNKALAAQQGAH